MPNTVSTPTSERATGENYHVEVGGYFWNPTPTSRSRAELRSGIVGDLIDFVEDLGIEKTNFRQLKVVLRPATKHKFRFEYTPIKYEQPDGTASPEPRLQRHLQPRAAGLDDAQMERLSLRLRVRLHLSRPRVLRDPARGEVHRRRGDARERHRREFVRARAPIPAIGAIGRVYVAPEHLDHRRVRRLQAARVGRGLRGKFFDFDIYGTVNLTDHFGGQVGYRRSTCSTSGDRRGRSEAQGPVLRRRRSILTTRINFQTANSYQLPTTNSNGVGLDFGSW